MSVNLLMRAGILQRIVALRTIKIALLDPRDGLRCRLLRATAVVDAAIDRASEELARYPDPEGDTRDEDGGYEDRDPLQNAVKGDLG